MHDPAELSKDRFPEAAGKYLSARQMYLKPRTFYGYEQHVKHLSVFFGSMRIADIHVGHLQEYQRQRAHNENKQWPKKAHASIINHELSTLQQILKRADQWTKIEKYYEPLKTPPPSTPKVMSDQEEMMLFDIASQNPDWSIAYWACSITCNTGASGTELRHIRLQDINLDARIPFFIIRPETAKNDFRGRPVVLNSTAEKQIRRCLERAASLGSHLPEHYLFPKRVRGTSQWNPELPTSASWLRRSFEALREAAGIPWLTPHCFRHQHITLRIESGEPIESVAKDVGHSSASMTRYYTHIRRETQLSYLDRIDPTKRFPPQSVRTNQFQQRHAK